MATVQECIEGAMRKLGIIAAGQTPRNDELEIGRQAVISMLRQLITSGTFGRMDNVLVATNYTAGPNQHVYRYGTYSQEIELASLIGVEDMIQNSGNTYQKSTSLPVDTISDSVTTPPDCSVIFISDVNNGVTTHFIFDGQSKRWMNIDNLQLSAEAPLADRDFEGYKSQIAILISDEFMAEVSPVTLQLANQFKNNLANRWLAPSRTIRQDYF